MGSWLSKQNYEHSISWISDSAAVITLSKHNILYSKLIISFCVTTSRCLTLRTENIRKELVRLMTLMILNNNIRVDPELVRRGHEVLSLDHPSIESNKTPKEFKFDINFTIGKSRNQVFAYVSSSLISLFTSSSSLSSLPPPEIMLPWHVKLSIKLSEQHVFNFSFSLEKLPHILFWVYYIDDMTLSCICLSPVD